MAKALSMDLRCRVIGAIAEGISCRQAAARFGISASTAIRWQAQQRAQGHVRPRLQGGDRRSGRVEAHAAMILGLLEEKPDTALQEMRSALSERGLSIGYGALWRFFHRHQITRKKRPHTPPSRIVRMS